MNLIKPPFENAYLEMERLVDARRHSWTYLSVLEWQDVKQLLLVRLWSKYALYDPNKSSGPEEKRLEKWTNRLITNALMNLKRDQGFGRLARPCIGGGAANGKRCLYNMGTDACSAPWVKSKTQCSECPLYAEWEKTRQHQFNLKSNVSLEYHAQEVSNVQGDFMDVAAIESELHREMLTQLTRWESMMYRGLFIQHLSPAEVSKRLESVAAKRKTALRVDELTSYTAVLAAKRRFEQMMKMILRRQGHIE